LRETDAFAIGGAGSARAEIRLRLAEARLFDPELGFMDGRS
jgi:hypothetical protein